MERVRVREQVSQQGKELSRGLTFSLYGVGHHLPDRTPELDVARIPKNPRVTTWDQTDLLEVCISR